MAAMNCDGSQMSEFFECTQCGDCCIGFGGTYVTKADIQAIANYLSISEAGMLNEYCSPSGDRLVLAQGSDGRCVFWDQNCTIHPVKPRMCRRWPFIPSLLVDVFNWHIMADSCPGIKRDINEKSLLTYVRSILGDSGSCE